MTENICIILGTRPEVIKMSPVVRACERRGPDWFVLHTGQHYSYGMDRVFFEEMELPDVGENDEGG
jgi:UDP-N-acetylglucosamine 2-epimerase (non-hydrolysing)